MGGPCAAAQKVTMFAKYIENLLLTTWNPVVCLAWIPDQVIRVRASGDSYSSLIGEKMELTSKGTERNNGITKETDPDEKQIMQWIATKPLPDQKQSVNLL